MSELSRRRVGMPVDGEDNPDLILVNTCAVTEKAAAKSRQMVSKMSRLYPDAEITVMGCSAAMDRDQFGHIDRVTKVIGTDERFDTEWWSDLSTDSGIGRDIQIKPISILQNRSRPRLKIQDGCEQNCSYCIIPSLRGKQRSVPLEDLLFTIRQMITEGAAEIVLTGVRIGSWGSDLHKKLSLLNLLEYLLEIPDIPRIRLGSIEPWELSEELIELVNGCSDICSHLHIPLQHTDPCVLERMCRPHLDRTLSLLKEAKNSNPALAIGIDLISGFPGETEEQFGNLIDTISDQPISYLHAFRFSARPGTPAYEYENQISPKIAKSRVEKLISIGAQKREHFIRSQEGKQFIAIPDKVNKDSEWVKAVTDNYIKLSVPAQGIAPGQPILVMLQTVSDHGCIGLPV